jgi:hypothetical protein
MNTTEKLAEALRLGKEGAPPTEAERLLFEAWMRGHCWALCATWNGKQYVSDAEQGGNVDPRAINTRQLFAAWRDRAALASWEAERAAPAEPVAVPDAARAAEMLGAYVEAIKASGDYERWHYIPEVEEVAEALAATPAAPAPARELSDGEVDRLRSRLTDWAAEYDARSALGKDIRAAVAALSTPAVPAGSPEYVADIAASLQFIADGGRMDRGLLELMAREAAALLAAAPQQPAVQGGEK